VPSFLIYLLFNWIFKKAIEPLPSFYKQGYWGLRITKILSGKVGESGIWPQSCLISKLGCFFNILLPSYLDLWKTGVGYELLFLFFIILTQRPCAY
jgi:hypothetical protein